MLSLDQKGIARELHDNIAQSFAAVNLMLQSLIEQKEFPADSTREVLNRIHTTARTANAELRRLIDAMSAPAPADLLNAPASKSSSPASQKLVAIDRLRRLGLVEALKEYFGAALSQQTVFSFEHHYQGADLAIEVELFRIAQESVSNAIRHGHASCVQVNLQADAHTVCLILEDNGRGLSQSDVSGVGLASMRARAQRLSGHLQLERSELGGLRVLVRIPINPTAP
jgi:signal transduction histidine kinase